MQRARRYGIVSIALCLGLGAFVALAACSNYDEGERCETLNGNDDCADPLQCIPKAQIPVPYNGSDRCCPANRAAATHPACMQPQNPIGGDSAPPPDTGPLPEAAPAPDANEASVPPVEAGDAADDGG